MKLIHKAMAGTMESSDIMITIEPKEEGGIQLELTSSVMQQFGRQIEAVIRETLKGLGVENALVTAAKIPYQHTIDIRLPGKQEVKVGINLRPMWKETLEERYA